MLIHNSIIQKHSRVAIICAFISLFFSIPSFSQKLKTYEDSVQFDKKKAKFEELFVKANLEKNKKNYEQATALYYDCVKLNSSNSVVYYELAQINYSMNNYTEAEQNIKKAIKINPNIDEYNRFLDDLYIKMGKKR